MRRDKQTSEKSMYDLILLGWSTVDVNANLCKSEWNFTIDVRARQVEIDLILNMEIFWRNPITELFQLMSHYDVWLLSFYKKKKNHTHGSEQSDMRCVH